MVKHAVVARRMTRLIAVVDALEARVEQPEVAQRARAQAAMDELASIPAAILIADDKGRYIDANDRAVDLTGYSRAELLRMSVWQLTPNVRLGLGRRLWRDFLARGRMSGTYLLKTKTGKIVTARYFAAANVLKGVHVSALLVDRRPGRRAAARKPSRR